MVKFIYSEKATKFCEIFTLFLSHVVPVKSNLKISQNFVAFSEYRNFTMKIDFDYFAAWIIQKSSFMKRWYLSITIYFYSKSLKFYRNLWENLRWCFQFGPILEKTNQIPNLIFFNLKSD